jgi:hypothetical protein
MLIDISENRKMIAATTDNTIYGNLSDVIKEQTSFAMGGAAIGFFYSVARRKSWLPYSFAGLILGGLVGWGVIEVKKQLQ